MRWENSANSLQDQGSDPLISEKVEKDLPSDIGKSRHVQ